MTDHHYEEDDGMEITWRKSPDGVTHGPVGNIVIKWPDGVGYAISVWPAPGRDLRIGSARKTRELPNGTTVRFSKDINAEDLGIEDLEDRLVTLLSDIERPSP